MEKKSRLEEALESRLRRRAEKGRLRRLIRVPDNGIDFSSNDYLSLASSQAIKQGFLRSLVDTPYLGSRGSRLLDGNDRLVEDLEVRLASFHGSENALIFNSGFEANVSIFSTIAQPGDAVVYDELIHASVHDGLRASRAGYVHSFKHNDMASLRSTLARIDGHHPNIFIATESLYSMDGDFAPLGEELDLIKSLQTSRGYLIVDEAHTTGLYGRQGRGLLDEFGLDQDDSILIRLHTFGKALGSSGAVILCSSLVKSYMTNYARPLVYSTAISPINLLHISSVYDFLVSGGSEPLSRHVQRLSKALRDGLRSSASGIDFGITSGVSPIIPLITNRPKELSNFLAASDRPVIARAICFPTVPLGAERVRVCIHAGNTIEEVQYLLDRLYQWTLIDQQSSRL